MERRTFEDSFQEALKKAEAQPAETVWAAIELDLLKAEGDRMKRRVFYYQLVAAASVSLAILFGGLGFFAAKERDNLQLAISQERHNEEGRSPLGGTAVSPSEMSPAPNRVNDQLAATETITRDRNDQPKRELKQNDKSSTDATLRKEADDFSIPGAGRERFVQGNDGHGSSSHKNSNGYNAATSDGNSGHDELFGTQIAEVSSEGIVEGGSIEINSAASPTIDYSREDAEHHQREQSPRTLPVLYSSEVPKLTFPREETAVADPVELMLARLNDLEKELAMESVRKERSTSKEHLWTSVAVAAGAFKASGPAGSSPGVQRSSLLMANNAPTASVVENQASASGVAYSVGISLGTQVAGRWVVQGGLNYLTEMSDYTSTQAVEQSGSFKAASVNHLRVEDALHSGEKFIPTAPYTVKNSNEYISIPLQAGYLIVKRRFVWQLNAGVSTDLFLQNTIDPNGNIDKTTSGAGDDSPFRTVNFSGLFGSEFSYRLSDHYRLGLSPGLRYPFSSIYKDELGVESIPITFDIGLRFRYIFR